jgi:hypothetical protein
MLARRVPPRVQFTATLCGLLIACGPPPSPADPADTADDPDTLPTPPSHGDALQHLEQLAVDVDDFPRDETVGGPTPNPNKWLDVAWIDDIHAILVGQGITVVAVDPLTVVRAQVEPELTMLHVDADNGIAMATIAGDGLLRIDLAQPWAPTVSRVELAGRTASHVDVDGGRVLVAELEAGAELLTVDGAPLLHLSNLYATAVALQGDVAVIGTKDHLHLYDVSSPQEPELLDTYDLPGPARDISVSGERMVVALGGHGTGFYDLIGGQIEQVAHMDTPGAAMDVAFDGEVALIAAWDVLAGFSWRPDGSIVPLGHETPRYLAMGVELRDRRAIVADWLAIELLRVHPQLVSAEVYHPASITTGAQDFDPVVELRNYGAAPLMVEASTSPSHAVEPSTVVVEPGESAWLTVTATQPDAAGSILLNTNDPDEAIVRIPVKLPASALGELHEDFERSGFVWPSTEVVTASLSSQRGRPILLSYFALS